MKRSTRLDRIFRHPVRKERLWNLTAWFHLDFCYREGKRSGGVLPGLSKEEAFSGTKRDVPELREGEDKHRKLLETSRPKGSRRPWRTISSSGSRTSTHDYVVELEYRKGMAYNEILMLAMKREEKALKLYKRFPENRLKPRKVRSVQDALPGGSQNTSSLWKRCTTITCQDGWLINIFK